MKFTDKECEALNKYIRSPPIHQTLEYFAKQVDNFTQNLLESHEIVDVLPSRNPLQICLARIASQTGENTVGSLLSTAFCGILAKCAPLSDEVKTSLLLLSEKAVIILTLLCLLGGIDVAESMICRIRHPQT